MDRLLFEAILIGLAGWRLANLLVNEDGPLEIFEHIRNIVGVRPGIISGLLPSIFTCIYCMSVWTTVISYGLWRLEPVIVMLLAAMSIAVVVNSIVTKE